MSDLRQAAQQALEAKQTPLIELLERIPQDARLVVEHDQFSSSVHPVGRLCHEAAAALRAALAEPVQERHFCPRCGKRTNGIHTCTPPAPLTDEVIADLWHQNGGFHHHFARAIERWLKGNP